MSKGNDQEKGFSTEAEAEKTARNSKKKDQHSRKSVIMGISMALVFVSIGWSTAIVGLGTDWALGSIIMLAPQATFWVFLLGAAFSKIFK